MSCPRIFPEGSDRSWTRAFYYGINKVMRRLWWEQNADEKLNNAIVDAMLYGASITR